MSSSEDASSGDGRRVVVVVLAPPGAEQPAVAGGARQCRRQPRPGDRHGLQGQQHGRRLQVRHDWWILDFVMFLDNLSLNILEL